MNATRIRTVIVTITEDDLGRIFSVQDGEDIASHLCWDEMLGAVVALTHPQITRAPYVGAADRIVTMMERAAECHRRDQSKLPAPLIKFEELPL